MACVSQRARGGQKPTPESALPSVSASALPDEPAHQPWYLLRNGLLLNSYINKPGLLARELQGSTCLCPPTPSTGIPGPCHDAQLLWALWI